MLLVFLVITSSHCSSWMELFHLFPPQSAKTKMASGGDDDRWGKRKMVEPQDKQMPHHGCVRTTWGCSNAAGRDVARHRGRRDQMIQDEENLERASRTIPLAACLDTPPHLEEFHRSYIRECSEDVVMRHPIDTRAHPVLNYARKLKMMEEARENNPNEQPKDLEIDYRFWNEFHSNFYACVNFNSKKSKVVKM